jgi:excisionase family DNA binding protein
MTTALETGPVAASESERPAFDKLEGMLRQEMTEYPAHVPALVGADGERIELPASLYHALRQLVSHLARGRAVTIVPFNKELTTQEAADILNVSRPYLVKLLEQGDIPFVKTGSHRRIRCADLMTYKQHRDAERRRGLAHLTQTSQELGLYEE